VRMSLICFISARASSTESIRSSSDSTFLLTNTKFEASKHNTHRLTDI
jgi:hypothetical protein